MREAVTEVRASQDLWASRMAPAGILERWLVPDGSRVRAGAAIARVRIESCLHDILAPVAGRFSARAAEGDLIDPDGVLAAIVSEEASPTPSYPVTA